ncbi:hypothetical protein BGZ90_000755, partial [Linnemannia elongata]
MLGAAQRNTIAGGPPLPGGSASTPNPLQPVAQAQPAAAPAATNTPNQIPVQAQPVTTPAVPVAPGVPHTLVTSPTPNLAQAQPAVAPIATAVPVALAASAYAPIQNPVHVQSALGQVQPAAAQTQPAAAPPIAITPPARGPLPKSLVAGMMTALVAATTPSQNNATLSTLESIALSAFTTAVTAAEAEALRPPLQEHLTLATALAVLGSQATTMAERLAVKRLAPLLLERDPDCPFKEYSFIYESPNLGSRIDALYVPRQHRPKLHSKRRRMAVAQYQILQLPLPLNQQLQRQMAVQWRAVCNFMYARQERYAKMRQFQTRLSTTLNENLGTGSWILRLNKRVQKKIFSDRVLSPEKLKGRQKSTSLKGNIEGVPYRVKDAGYAVEKLVRDRFASALSYAIEQQMDEHRHYMNRLMARMIKHFHKPATPGRRGGVNWLTSELQGLYNKIQLIYRNEQTIHQKALEETAQQQVVSRHSWELLTKQQWEWHQYERDQLRVHHHLSQEVWRWRVRLQDPDLLAEMRLWSRTIFIRPNSPSLTELAAMAPPIPEYSCPVSELLYECSPAVMAWRHQQAALQQTLAQFQEYEARLAQFHDINLEIGHKSNLEMEKLERKRVSGRTQQERQDAENEMNALFFLTKLEHSKVLVEENRLKLAFGEWVNEQKMQQLQDSQHLIPAAQLQLQQQILQAQQQNQQLQQQLQQKIHNQQQHQVQVQQHRQPVQQAGADIVGAPTAPPIPIAIQPAIRVAPAIIITPPQAILPTAPFPISRTNNLLPLANYPLITTRTRKATDDDIDMDYDPETAIAQYKYTPLHSNLGIAATLAAMNLEAAIKRLPAYNTCSLVRANLDHGYQHIYHCAAIRAWVYSPKHSDPSAALTLAYMDMLSASAAVGFSFCDSLEKMGHIHLNECIPKEEEGLEKLRKEELIAAETSAVAATANHPTPVAPSVSNVFNFGTVPNGGVQIQSPQQSQPHQQPQSQQQQSPSSSNSFGTNPTPSRDSGYGSTPSPPIAPPEQEISQPPHTLASTSLPSTPSSSVPAPTPLPVAAVVPAPTSSQRRSKKDKWSANYVKSRKIENSKNRKRRYSSDACDAPSDSSNSSSSFSDDDDSGSEYDSDSNSEFGSDDEAYQQWRRRFKKKKQCHASSSKKPSMRTETATTKKSKKVAEFKAWRAKELAQKRRSQGQYYFRRLVLSRRAPSPFPSPSPRSTPPPTSPTPKRGRVRCDDEPSHVEAFLARNPAVTLISDDEEEEKLSKHRCRRAMSIPTVTRSQTNSSSSSTSAPAFGLSKKMKELLTPSIRNKQPLQLREQ